TTGAILDLRWSWGGPVHRGGRAGHRPVEGGAEDGHAGGGSAPRLRGGGRRRPRAPPRPRGPAALAAGTGYGPALGRPRPRAPRRSSHVAPRGALGGGGRHGVRPARPPDGVTSRVRPGSCGRWRGSCGRWRDGTPPRRAGRGGITGWRERRSALARVRGGGRPDPLVPARHAPAAGGAGALARGPGPGVPLGGAGRHRTPGRPSLGGAGRPGLGGQERLPDRARPGFLGVPRRVGDGRRLAP